MSAEVDAREWTKFNKDVLKLAEETMPRECKKFMRREGGRLKTATKREARSTIKKKTGNYLNGVKNSRAWRSSSGDYGDKVYSNAPHGHLIEYGHKVVTHNGRDTGFRAKDFHIFEKANDGFQKKFWNDALEFTEKIVADGFKGK